MRDTTYMDIFERRLNAPPVSQEEGLRILQKQGLELAHQPEPCDDWDHASALEAAGRGTWDENGAWTPSSRQFYAADAESSDPEQMYQGYFAGLRSIASELDLRLQGFQTAENGEDTIMVRFLVNGNLAEYTAQTYGDLLDTGIQRAINDALERLSVEKRFYSIDTTQGTVVFYCTEEWARAFEEATLCFMNYDGI